MLVNILRKHFIAIIVTLWQCDENKSNVIDNNFNNIFHNS